MDKGWGVTLENNSDQVRYFGNKKLFGFNLSPKSNRNQVGSIMFPVNSSGKEEMVLGEVDFFSKKRPINEVIMKKESSPGEFDVNTGLQLVIANTGSDQSTVDDGISLDVEDERAKNELAQLQVELERMNAENQRLKGMLTQVNNNYTALQMHYVTVMQHQQNSKADSTQVEQEIVERKSEEAKQENGGSIVPRQFLDLASGVGADEQSISLSEEITLSGSPHNNIKVPKNKRIGREESPESKGWSPNKAPRLSATPKPVDQATEATMRKVRVSVRAQSEAPMISDGCQWRKYGQKMAKGNPCPRAYYRCTMAVGCPVRKQVQRCAEDRAILITTYEGTHNHPLPPAAMAMASTTSAAATMLLSGSMPSADGLMNPNFLARTILPCSNMATISASAPFPTVTLDLTQTPNPFQRPAPQFQVPFNVPPQYFNQAATPSNPQQFGQVLYNQSKFSGLQLSQGTNEATHFTGQQQHPQQHLFNETLSAATAAITNDPNFTAALAAAISSIMGGGQPNNNSSHTNANEDTNNSNKTSSSFPRN